MKKTTCVCVEEVDHKIKIQSFTVDVQKKATTALRILNKTEQREIKDNREQHISDGMK